MNAEYADWFLGMMKIRPSTGSGQRFALRGELVRFRGVLFQSVSPRKIVTKLTLTKHDRHYYNEATVVIRL